jgi:hypothetical protein
MSKPLFFLLYYTVFDKGFKLYSFEEFCFSRPDHAGWQNGSSGRTPARPDHTRDSRV